MKQINPEGLEVITRVHKNVTNKPQGTCNHAFKDDDEQSRSKRLFQTHLRREINRPKGE
jgi:hypothetical protein